MAWWDRLGSFFLDIGKELRDAGQDLRRSGADLLSPDVAKPERKRAREVRKEQRQVSRVTKKRERKARPSRKERKAAPPPSPRPTPGVSPSRGKEGGGWVLVAGNPDIVSLENERGSYPTRSLGMAAYLNALESIGSEQMVALVHWRSGQLPYVLYVGYVEMSE